MNRQTVLDLLRRTGEDLARYMNEVPPESLHWREPGEWSAHETLAHIASIDRQVFLPRLRRIAAEDRPVLKFFDEQAWHREHYDSNQPTAGLLADFADARRQEIALLESQPDWSRWGMHETLHKRHSLAYIAHYAFRHTWEHLNQIAGTQVAYELAQQE